MGEYKRSDFVTVVDEDGIESEVPKTWVGTGLLPEGVKKVDGRRRSPARDAAAELDEAKAAAEAAVQRAETAEARVKDLEAEAETFAADLESLNATPPVPAPASDDKK